MTIKNVSKHNLYSTWKGMKQRCYNQASQSYKNYGGRGIRVCPDWFVSFVTFLDDMGEKPTQSHTLDRIDNNGDYTPENCKWSTRVEQARNTTRNHYLFYKGKDTLLVDVAKDIGITQQALQGRLAKMPLSDALAMKANRDRKRYIEANGRCLTLDGWAKELNLSRSGIARRLDAYSPDKALDKNGNIRFETIVNRRKVEQLTKTGEHVAYYDSLTEAGKLTNTNFKNIQSVCKGIRITTGGYKWRYV